MCATSKHLTFNLPSPLISTLVHLKINFTLSHNLNDVLIDLNLHKLEFPSARSKIRSSLSSTCVCVCVFARIIKKSDARSTIVLERGGKLIRVKSDHEVSTKLMTNFLDGFSSPQNFSALPFRTTTTTKIAKKHFCVWKCEKEISKKM